MLYFLSAARKKINEFFSFAGNNDTDLAHDKLLRPSGAQYSRASST